MKLSCQLFALNQAKSSEFKTKRMVFAQGAPKGEAPAESIYDDVKKPDALANIYANEREGFLRDLKRHAEGKIDKQFDSADHRARASQFIEKVQQGTVALDEKKAGLEAAALKSNREALKALRNQFYAFKVEQKAVEKDPAKEALEKNLALYKVIYSSFKSELNASSQAKFSDKGVDFPYAKWRVEALRSGRLPESVLAKSDQIIMARSGEWLKKIESLFEPDALAALNGAGKQEYLAKNLKAVRALRDEYRAIVKSVTSADFNEDLKGKKTAVETPKTVATKETTKESKKEAGTDLNADRAVYEEARNRAINVLMAYINDPKNKGEVAFAKTLRDQLAKIGGFDANEKTLNGYQQELDKVIKSEVYEKALQAFTQLQHDVEAYKFAYDKLLIELNVAKQSAPRAELQEQASVMFNKIKGKPIKPISFLEAIDPVGSVKFRDNEVVLRSFREAADDLLQAVKVAEAQNPNFDLQAKYGDKPSAKPVAKPVQNQKEKK